MNEDIKTISEALRHQRCVIFFGAGISAESGLPTGKDLVRQLLKLPEGKSIEEFDLAKWAQIIRYRQANDRAWLHERLIKLLADPRSKPPQPNELHKILALLNCKYYVTTNYDRLFDKVLEEYLGIEDFPSVIYDKDIPKAIPITYIKLHGDIYNPESIVLTYDDYEARFEENPNLLHLLFSLFSQNLVLFVGYSLKDPNILSVVRKIGHGKSVHAKGMYIALFEPDEDEIDFFRSLNVHVIPIQSHENESIASALKRFLLTLWDHTLDFNFYLNPEPNVQFSSFLVNLEIAIASYRRAEYDKAFQQFKAFADFKATDKISIWGKNPGAFAQYAYFSLKTLDKLNYWDQIKATRQELMNMLDEISSVYPNHIIEFIHTQINASSGISMMRATLFQEAQKYLESALEPGPDLGVIGKDAILLHADRHTVLACIYLNLIYFEECDQPVLFFQKAGEHLAQAEELFKKYDDVDGPHEVHYLGRLFGVRAFHEIAQIRLGGKPFQEEAGGRILKVSRKAHREIIKGKNRVSYGRFAGKYCEAMADLFLAQEYQRRGNTKEATRHYKDCERILGECLNAEQLFEVKLSTLDKCKVYRAFQVLLESQSAIADEPVQLLEKAKEYEAAFQQEKDSLVNDGMLERVLQDQNWIFTPLN